MDDLELLIRELVRVPVETEWLEFKLNKAEPELIGKAISALANVCVLCNRDEAYMVWGIEDKTHEIVGTRFRWRSAKGGGENSNEDIVPWLQRSLSANVAFKFEEVKIDGKLVTILIIKKAIEIPVQYKKIEYIRVGSYTKELIGCQQEQKDLWTKLRFTNFESLVCRADVTPECVLKLLDYGTFLELLYDGQYYSSEAIIHYLEENGLVKKQDNGLYAVTYLGAILFAKDISKFEHVSRKAVRVIQFKGQGKLETIKDFTLTLGYAAGFKELMTHLNAILPSNEVIEQSFRKTISVYPPIAVREAVANALIHQDFLVRGTGTVIEIYADRIEITNPGKPLIQIERIIDNPPKTRNEKLAALMRRMRMCEESGTGWDKIVAFCEVWQLPAPKIETYAESTKVILYAHVEWRKMTVEDKLRTCYLHACLRQVMGEYMTNSSLRKRLGLPDSASSRISKLIKDAIDANLIKILDPHTAPKHVKYVPYWA